ncbi:uroporphyrinogen-III synthase [Rickettsia peacockii str. Rustic]|uniref:Uroporphyrinogen-III synthase n=1 Tax=Rickettsia peacockii (strain Rustic) TaxID=562019 RepID=C4K1Y7_RICPU|nr:uroporphyrinogen-III synthase [Rickettsia peacockii]ACR47585.1 uroporphyrinogen-III synthase [Rickettsia peacockii str. Rustic]
MKSVLLTRHIEENNETIKEISKYHLDLRDIHCPLIKYNTLDFNIDILDNYSNIIITSKYAASILTGHNLKQDIWVVGSKSKRLLGKKVMYTAKNVEDLIKHFPPDLYEQTIYLSSNEITKDLPSKIVRHIIYNVEYLNELPVSIIKAFKNNIDFILLYSQNSARTLVKLLLQNNLLEYLQDSLVVAISLKVANIVRPFIKNVVYCDDQNLNDIIKLLSENVQIR